MQSEKAKTLFSIIKSYNNERYNAVKNNNKRPQYNFCFSESDNYKIKCKVFLELPLTGSMLNLKITDMIGDFKIWIRLKWKQMWCNHEYKPNRLALYCPNAPRVCKICGRHERW